MSEELIMDNYTLPLKKNRNTPCRRRRNYLRALEYRHKRQLATCEVGTQTDPPKEDPPQEKLEYPERELIAADNSALLKVNTTPDDATP